MPGVAVLLIASGDVLPGTPSEAGQAARTERDHDRFLQGPAMIYLDRLPRGEDMPDTTAAADRLGSRVVPRLLADPSPRRMVTSESASAPYRAMPSEDEARIVPGGCNICFNACTVKYHLRGERVVNVMGNDEDPVFRGRICPKSQMTLQLYNNPLRLTQPLMLERKSVESLARNRSCLRVSRGGTTTNTRHPPLPSVVSYEGCSQVRPGTARSIRTISTPGK